MKGTETRKDTWKTTHVIFLHALPTPHLSVQTKIGNKTIEQLHKTIDRTFQGNKKDTNPKMMPGKEVCNFGPRRRVPSSSIPRFTCVGFG